MNPDMALITDRVALVTGGAAGIGSAIARCLAAFGADVVVADIDDIAAEDTVAQIRALGRKGTAIHCDVTRQQDVDGVVDRTVRELGPIHILVNSAGNTFRKLFMDMTEAEWYAMLELNLVQIFRCTRAVAKVMMEQGTEGSIINMSTIEAYRGAPGYAPYAAAKAGMVNFTKTMALELSPWRIRVNSIAPDATNTPGSARRRVIAAQEGKSAPPVPEIVPRHIPSGRRGTPEDYGGPAIFLASDLSKWVTGEIIQVGGGTFASSGWQRTDDGYWSNGGPPQIYSGKPLLEDL